MASVNGGTARKRQRLSGLERREVILETALGEFAKLGYSASLDEIARLSGVTKPVLYDHFPSKQALFLEVLRGIRGRLLGAGEQALHIQGNPEARVRAAVLGFFAEVEREPALVRVLLGVARGEPELERAAAEIQAEVTEAILRLYLDLLPRRPGPKERDRLRLKLEFLKQGLHALAEWWPTQPHLSKEQLTEAVMGVAWRGLADSFE